MASMVHLHVPFSPGRLLTPLSSPILCGCEVAMINRVVLGQTGCSLVTPPLPSPSIGPGPTQALVSLDGSSLVPQLPVEPLVEPSVVEVVVVNTLVECPSVAVVVAPSGPAVPVSTDVTLFLRVLSGAEPLATLQVVAHVELTCPSPPIFLYR